MATNAAGLATALVSFVVEQLTAASAASLPGLDVPSVYGGHPVDEATSLDLAYTLGLLAECGVPVVAGVPCNRRAVELIAGVDQRRVDTFASYRMGETIARVGGLDAFPMWDDTARYRAVATVASRGTPPKVRASELPRNYAVVAARCLRAAQVLRDGDDPDLREFIGRVKGLFTETGTGWVNDAPWGAPTVFDIYTADMYLFAEPLAPLIGDEWTEGFRSVLADLDDIVQPGGAITWGRSVGSLGLAMTIELAAIGNARNLVADPARWLARAELALFELRSWFRNGIVAAHQERATMYYRGPARRLQLTFDLLGKLLLAALDLRAHPATPIGEHGAAWPDVDRVVTFDPERNCGVWAYRSRHLDFVVPMVCGWSSDYVPSPRSPGLFEQPTSGHPAFLPVAHVSGWPLVPAGVPTSVEHGPGRLTLAFDGWAPAGSDATHEHARPGTATVEYRVDRDRLVVKATTGLGPVTAPATLSFTVPETDRRPLAVAIEGTSRPARTIDTDGIAEWRSFWGPLPTVRQFEFPDVDRTTTLSATPRIRVASTAYSHPYDRGLYDPVADRIVLGPAPGPNADLQRRLLRHDVLHVAWPEWWTGVDPEWTRTSLASVRTSRTPIVWTQHNLLPHADKSDAARLCYQQWAQAATAVIHHTEWGRDLARNTYEYGPDTTHHVLRHGHWGHRYAPYEHVGRADVEAEFGWEPCAIRLAVVGAPRAEKDCQLVIDAFVAANRPDMQLLVRADDGEVVPDDPRIVRDRGHTPDDVYHRRMRGVDAIVLPFAPSGMLTTGTAFDAIGAGIAAITSDWAFFDETFEGADIRYGSTVEDLAAVLRSLTPSALATSSAAVAAQRDRHSWAASGAATADLFEEIRAAAASTG